MMLRELWSPSEIPRALVVAEESADSENFLSKALFSLGQRSVWSVIFIESLSVLKRSHVETMVYSKRSHNSHAKRRVLSMFPCFFQNSVSDSRSIMTPKCINTPWFTMTKHQPYRRSWFKEVVFRAGFLITSGGCWLRGMK